MSEDVQNKIIRIDSQDQGSRVLLSSDNEDRFVLSCAETVRAAQFGVSGVALHDEIRAILAHVRQWISERADDRIVACFGAFRDGQIVIIFVTAMVGLDSSLSDALTALDVEIAEKFQACPCDVLEIPPGSEATFVPPLALQVYGDQRATSGQVAT